ncbi:MAG: S46 family peptidase [Bacteroidales bacterium]|nr:S46 family peptidase [Bacteroidales bacterium]
MKVKFLSVMLILSLGFVFQAKSDEGMWLPNKIKQLNYADMQKLGCKLTAEEIYSINGSSLKDAIFQLQNEEGQGFCTGEMVSPQGLMFTNHHCGYEAIAKLSSTTNDYLTHGFWAMKKSDELPVEGMKVSRVVRIEDVSEQVLADVTFDMSESEREKKISAVISKLEKTAVEGTHYNCKVKEMFKGGEYYLFVFEVFGDVRLAGAPPSAIGKFGGDTDNWMWPRHTGDFSIFRVYMSPEGNPTDAYSPDNVPYKPLHHLPVSMKGIQPGDFTMIFGYPGETDRYLSSFGMEYKRDVFNPIVVKLLNTKLVIMKRHMAESDAVRIALSDTYASLANGWKLFDGEALTLKKTDAIAQKQGLEDEFADWATKNDDRSEKYSKILPQIKEMYSNLAGPTKEMIYLSLGLLQASEHTMTTLEFYGLKSQLADAKNNKDAITKSTEELKEKLGTFFDKYYPVTDKEIMMDMIMVYYNDIDADKRSGVFENYIFKTFKGKTQQESIKLFVDAVFAKSIFTSRERMEAFLNKPSAKVLDNDPMMKYLGEIIMEAQMKSGMYTSVLGKLEVAERKFIAGLREMETARVFYPDANSTLRLTYGTVQSYKPRDAVKYSHITYIDGIIEKMDNTNDEFTVPKKLVDLYEKKDFGPYVDETGNLPVAFLSDNDITGGNSGSPILNGEGHLIGLAFDGNWEWLCSNLLFSTELQRTINVDVRYVLWVIDKYAGAGHLLDEMTLIK